MAFQGALGQLLDVPELGAEWATCSQQAREADAITLDGGAIYEAGKEHGLKPVVGEVYDQGQRAERDGGAGGEKDVTLQCVLAGPGHTLQPSSWSGAPSPQ